MRLRLDSANGSVTIGDSNRGLGGSGDTDGMLPGHVVELGPAAALPGRNK